MQRGAKFIECRASREKQGNNKCHKTEANGTAPKLHPRDAPVPSSYQKQQQHDVQAE